MAVKEIQQLVVINDFVANVSNSMPLIFKSHPFHFFAQPIKSSFHFFGMCNWHTLVHFAMHEQNGGLDPISMLQGRHVVESTRIRPYVTDTAQHPFSRRLTPNAVRAIMEH